jgi:ketosteroid isomerase-like protein
MKHVARAVAILLFPLTSAAHLSAQGAPRVSTSLTILERADLEVVRKAVWVDWFSGDTAALRRTLTPELVAISPGAPHWQSLNETLAASAAFKASGGKLVSVSFDSSTVHRFGNVVVMFSHYIVVTESEGKRQTQKGRATEVFVRSGGRWVHTSWHLDAVA